MASKYAANTNHKFLKLPNKLLGIYNLWDAHETARLVGPLLKELEDNGQLEFYQRYIEPFQYAVLAMQRAGLLLDRDALRRYRRHLRAELRGVDQAIRRHADEQCFQYTDKFPSSDHQVSKYLFDVLGLKASKRTAKTGRASVDQDSLMRVLRGLRKRDLPHQRLLWDLFHRSRVSTLLDRYLKDLEPDPDGRVRAQVKMSHVKTLRLAYAEPALQQWPDEARHFFVAAPGQVLLAADYAQLEARLLAYYSEDPVLVEAFAEGEDVHAVNARDLFAITEEEWAQLENPSPYRQYAKTFLYRLIYGGSAATGDKKLFCPCPRCAHRMPDTLSLTPSKGAEAERRWLFKHPAVPRFQEQVAQQVRRDHYFVPLLGGKRYISKPWGADLARELKNIPMQTGGAHLMNRAQAQLHQAQVNIILQHHDSFIDECPLRQVEQDAQLIQEAMCQEATIQGRRVRFPIDFKVGYNWGRYHPKRNPDGMRGWEPGQPMPPRSGEPAVYEEVQGG